MDSPGFQRRHRLPRGVESLALRGPLRRLHRIGHRQLPGLRHRSRRRKRGHKALAGSRYFRPDDRAVDVCRAARLARWKVGHECRQLPYRTYHRSPRAYAIHSPVARLAVRISPAAPRHPAARALQSQRFQQNDFRCALRIRIRRHLCRRIPQSRAPPQTRHPHHRSAHRASLHLWYQRDPRLCIPGLRRCIGPIPQALRRAFSELGLARVIVPAAVLLLFTNYLSTFCLNFTANSRLPMVAGWDHLLPEWFTRLHAKYKTPVNSIFFLGGITIATSVVVLAGVGDQEAFELLQIWGFTFYGLAYLALFAIPLLARKERGIRPGWWLRFAAASGFLVTLLFVLLSILPIISVKSESAYAIKTAAVLIGATALGLLLYRLGSRGRSPSNAA